MQTTKTSKTNLKAGIGALRISLIIGILLMVVKMIAYLITSSNAILTDALESIVNIITGAFALYSLHFASQPKDHDHPYGHGKIEYFSAGIEGGLICMAGITILFKSVYNLISPQTITRIESGLVLIALTGLINFILGKYLYRKGEALHSETMKANGKHLISDTWSSLGLVIGLVLVKISGYQWLDAVLAIGLGCYIAFMGIKILYNSIGNLLDKADLEKLNAVISLLNKYRRNTWIDMHNLRVIKYGSHLHFDAHLTLPWYLNLEQSHAEVTAVESLIQTETEQEVELFIHADPCLPTSCPVCPILDCKVRKAEFQKRLTWTIDNLLPNKKHHIG